MQQALLYVAVMQRARGLLHDGFDFNKEQRSKVTFCC